MKGRRRCDRGPTHHSTGPAQKAAQGGEFTRVRTQTMKGVEPPIEEQIDVALTGRYWDFVRRYCNGTWSLLPQRWSASYDQIIEEAKKRGLKSFVATRPTSEGYWLLETERGYVVFYLERGVRMYDKDFEELEPAVAYWLDQDMRAHMLPGRGKS
jgi:hypothetical protein